MTSKKGPRLGVNIDHVATLRQARGENYPSIVDAAKCSLDAGADQITIHLREDRRHIQDTDVPAVKMVTEQFGKPLNLEIGAHQEILDIAKEIKPQWCCLVPEKREEKTTEGGLNLMDEKVFNKIKAACDELKKNYPEGKISLFVESRLEILQRAADCQIDAVEIHTGDYASHFLAGESLSQYYTEFQIGADFIKSHNLGYHAGHGLTDESLVPLVNLGVFEEYNIGHWIICDSVFCGLDKSIKKLINIINKH